MTGFRRHIGVTDPKLKELQVEWYRLKAEWVDAGSPDSGSTWHAFQHHDKKLCDYIWGGVEAAVAEDRKRHPKAKRNRPVGSDSEGGGGRVLP